MLPTRHLIARSDAVFTTLKLLGAGIGGAMLIALGVGLSVTTRRS